MVAYVYPRRLTRREYSGVSGLPSLCLCLCLWRAPHTHGCPATVAASTAAARSLHAASSSAPAAVGLARRWGSLFECAARGAPPLALRRPRGLVAEGSLGPAIHMKNLVRLCI